MARLVALTLLFGCCSAHAVEQVRSIPPQFQGEWNIDISDCGTDLNDSRLRIERKQIRHYESRDLVQAVVTDGRREIALITHSRGEGAARLSTLQYRLSADGRRLTDIRNEQELVRYRCPIVK